VLIRGEGLDELLDVERSRAADGVMGQPFEFTEVAITAKAQVYEVAWFADHDVVALVLGVRPPEDGPHVVRLRVAVHGEAGAADGVELAARHLEVSADLRVRCAPR
jgi:hypothetical protein